MIDVHSHILPGMDDGSSSTAESVQMLRALAQQGVQQVVATPHFYASQDRLDTFLSRRESAAAAIRSVWEPGFPQMTLGAEVYFFNGISRTEELELLKLSDSELLLLEMPFSTWTEHMIAELLELQARRNVTVLLAHIERYLSLQKTAVWHRLLEQGVLMQCNASFFLNRRTKRKALRILRKGNIHFLGSDCHNMTTRPPRIGDAMEVIVAALGDAARQSLEQEAAVLLNGAEVG